MSNAARQFQLNPIASSNLLDPMPLYKELRKNDPIHWSDGARAWFITRHADVMNGLRDPRLCAAPPEPGTEREGWEREEDEGRLVLRRRTALVFTFQSLDLWQRALRPLARRLVVRVRQAGRADAVAAVTRQLPAGVMAELLDIPAAERARFIEWALRLAEARAPEADADEALLARRAHEAEHELLEYLGHLVDQRRQEPGGDLLSRLLHGSGAGEDPAVWAPRTVLCLMAEHACSADLLGNGLNELLAHPEQWRRLRADGSLLRGAVEEVLRFSPAVPFVHRVAAETFLWQGRSVRKGDEVFLGLAAANRDPAVVEDPERFDITRDPYGQRHLSFGFGAHHNLSAGLIRRELETLLEVVLEELPNLRPDPERLPQLKCHSLLFRGLETLPVCA